MKKNDTFFEHRRKGSARKGTIGGQVFLDRDYSRGFRNKALRNLYLFVLFLPILAIPILLWFTEMKGLAVTFFFLLILTPISVWAMLNRIR